ncbi:MAG: transglutaminase family protein [Desulfuromonadaceae bacterium]|nr:transglutaminase family protein [Desulfuromonadaceae bacterium]MDD2856136.1 transglutaminase family protein [Desulfuromonadaceae bacterium]
MRYLIEHETILDYPSSIREHHIELRLAPRTDGHQKVHSCVIETEPAAELSSYSDYFGNRVDYFSVIPPHNRLVTRLRSEVETFKENPFSFESVPKGEEQEWLAKAVRNSPPMNDFVLHRSLLTPSVLKLAEPFETQVPKRDKEQPLLDFLLELLAWVPTVMEYRTGSTEVHGSLETALAQKGGVCQDFAHLFITIARSYGIPARYVMGYLDPGISQDGDMLTTHAWAEALVPGAGWVGFDATHNLLTNDHYVAVAVGRDSYDAAPQRGSFKGVSSGEQPTVTVTMQEQ